MGTSLNPYVAKLAEIGRRLDADNAKQQSYAGREANKRAHADNRARDCSPWGDNYGVLGLADEPAALWAHHVGHHGP